MNAWDEGYVACKRFKNRDANPHTPGRWEWHEWRSGWEFAHREFAE